MVVSLALWGARRRRNCTGMLISYIPGATRADHAIHPPLFNALHDLAEELKLGS
jgi:hypothetical protein